jgi:hypothetical protein
VNVEVLREAEEELNASIAYYEEIEPGLGIRLKEQTLPEYWLKRKILIG